MLEIEKSKVNESIKALVDKFLNIEAEKYILGRNENSKRLSKVVNVGGYIDDFTTETQWNDKPIYKSNQITNKEAIVVSCSLAIYPHSAISSLQKAGFKNILSVLDIAMYSDLEVMFMSDAKKDLEVNFPKYENIYNCMKETESQNVFRNIISFRNNFDLKYMKDYEVDEKGQYFEDFLDLQDGEVFVDAGGFDGQTSIEFIKHCSNYKAVYILSHLKKT